MDTSAIKAWLENPDRNYFDGIALFEKYGSNMAMVYNLRRLKSASHEDRLVYELEKLVALPEEEVSTEEQTPEVPEATAPVNPANEALEVPAATAPANPSVEAPKVPAASAPATTSEPKKNSDLLQGLLDERASKYAGRNIISDTLADLEGDNLKNAAIRVQEIDDEIIALTTQIQYVEQHGHLPVAKVDLVEDLESFKKKKKSLGEKLSRIKGDLKRTPGNLKKEAQVADITSQIDALDLKIRALTQATD